MFTIYSTQLDAILANTAAAYAAGCNMTTTTFLFTRIDHPTDGRSALADGTGSVTREQMIIEGFIVDDFTE